MRKLNLKNKVFIVVFSLIILGIIGLLVYAVKLVGNKGKEVYAVTSNTVLFANDSNQIDTKNGGRIEKKWSGDYYFLASNQDTYKLGKSSVVYETSNDTLTIFGDNYQVFKDGNVAKLKDSATINDLSVPYFYKLEDRVYLIVADEIYNEDKSIFANKYLLIYIDKQGNASVLNDVLNIKTINPMILYFGNFTFDIANEKLIVDEKSIDLKAIIGSTNEYVVPEKEEDVLNFDSNKLIESYNELVNDFNQYASNNKIKSYANNQVIQNNNTVINNNTTNNGETIINNNGGVSNSFSNNAVQAKNKTNLVKRVSLRGSISYPTFIDVSYIVTDPENKYQAVYLLVTGEINGEVATQKIILDKYDTKYRIVGLATNSEYSISLGYIEVVKDEDTGEKSLVDNIEDVINVRTTKTKYALKVEKISNGYVYFNYKMTSDYAFESGKIVLYAGGNMLDEVLIDTEAIKSEKGFEGRLKLEQSNLYEIRVEEAVYNGKNVNDRIVKSFAIPMP